MTVIDELIAVLGFEIQGGEKVQEFQKTLDGSEASAKKSAAAINKLGLAVGAATTVAISAGTAALKSFAGFEREMTRIGITAGATASETAAAGVEVQKLAKGFALPLEQAILGLDTLTASGMNLQQAMSFLPSVLATAQASGASTADIANTIQKVSMALKIPAEDAQKAFDIMVAGGKAGQFELKDMAQYIPQLSSAFSAMGYEGLGGLRDLIVLMQTLREKTGASSAAATQLDNILGKAYSTQTAKSFDNFGVDLPKEMAAFQASGLKPLDAFVEITRETIGNDLTKLPRLFQDNELRLGMLSLVTGAESMEKFNAALKDVDGSTMVDLSRVLNDTQASLDKTSSSLDRFWKSLGGAIAGPAGGTLDFLSNDLDYGEAIRNQLQKQGMGYWERENWMFMHAFDQASKDELARKGGYAGPVTQNRRTPGVPIFPSQISEMRDRLGTGTAALVDRSNGSSASMADIEALIARSSTKFAATETGRAAFDDLQAKVLAGQQSQFDSLRAQVEASMGRATGAAGAAPIVNDNRQDNRQYPVSVSAPVTVQVQQASQAPGAVGSAIAGAIATAAQTPARIAAEPASTGWGGPR